MNVLLVYFTGTYNTRFLVSKAEERFVNLGASVKKIEINKDSPIEEISSYDYIGFSYPIYGFNAPSCFVKYIKKMKFKPQQRFFIFKNSGETMALNNASSRKIFRLMKKNKGIFLGEYHFIMPYNIHFPFEEDFIKQIIKEDKKLLDIMFYNLNHNVVKRIKSNLFFSIAAFFVSIQAIGGNINSFFYRIDRKKCSKCGLCVKNCPSNNIELKNNKIIFHHSCYMCMRCSFYCPQKAISIGFLQNWLVHKYYNLENLWQDDEPSKDYINDNSKGFYKCFIKTFKNIDEEYESIAK